MTEDGSRTAEPLPENRFELELEFVQSLASPAYLHFLSTSVTREGTLLLEDTDFQQFLRYLYRTWTDPDYSQYIIYPHSLYFLHMLINNESFGRELAQISFRNFCHQQQFYAWQNRFATLYGKGKPQSLADIGHDRQAHGNDDDDNNNNNNNNNSSNNNSSNDADTNMNVQD